MGEHTSSITLKWKGISSIALSLALLAVVLIQVPVGAEGAAQAARAGENDVKIFFHAGGNLSTVPPDSQVTQPEILTDGEQMNFTTGVSLGQDLNCLGKDVSGSSGKGLWLYLSCTEPVSGGANLSVSVYDGAAKVAAAVIPKANLRDSPKSIPFVNPSWDSYTFKTGNKLKVLFEADVDTMAIGINYDSQNFAGYLLFTCTQVVIGNNSLKIMDSQGIETEEFVPNHPKSDKAVFFEGSVSDIIGNYDVEQVRMTIKDPTAAVVLDNATEVSLDPNQHDLTYRYEWYYNTTVVAGTYTVMIQIHDNSGNVYNITDTFSFSRYGVYISTGTTSKAGSIGGSMEFVVRVYNTGGDSDTLSITYNSQNNWGVGVDKSSLTLAGGEYGDVLVTVLVPDTASPGDSDTISVKGTSVSSGKFEELMLRANAVSSYNFVFETKGSVNSLVNPGQTRTITIELTNSGDQEDTYEVFVNQTPPASWNVSLQVPGGQKESLGSNYLEYKVTLASQQSIDILLDVSVSSSPQVATATIELGAMSLGDQEFKTSHYLKYTMTTEINLDTFVKFVGDSKRTAGISSREDLTYMRVDFQISVQNPQTTTMKISVAVQIENGWNTNINPTSFDLGNEESKTINIGLTPPKGAVAGDRNFAVNINDQAIPSKLTKTLNGKVTIPQIRMFGWSVEKDDQTIKEYSDKLTYMVRLENKGNVQTETVKLDIVPSDAKGWNVEIPADQETKTLIKGGNDTIEVEVSVDTDVNPKSEFTFQLRINGTTEMSPIFTAKTEVSPKYLQFFSDFWWVPVGLVAVIMVAVFLRYKQTRAKGD